MPDASTDNKPENNLSGAAELANLRNLILEPEQSEISELKERLNNPRLRAEELSKVIAEAIVMRASKDQKLVTALLPTIETVLRDTVKKDPKFLADTIFPVIGPAIRKAISESLRSMMESMSTTLEHTFSWRGIQWRIESIRTGKPFAEIVLLHTLIYRLEQVFLIHKETGLVLQHVAAESIDVKDTGMVSGMLTAIQDFVNDSFSGKEDTALKNLDMGELIVWIEQGPRTVLAAVIRGSPPAELRTRLKEIVENIEFEYNLALENFKGDAAPFEACRPDLLYGLSQSQQTDRKAKKAITKLAASVTKRQPVKKSDPMLFIYVAGILCIIVLILGYIFSRL
jgi:hypothetical protein